MPVISHTIRTARKIHKCHDCLKTIRPGECYHRLYGSAELEDPKYELKICSKCYTAVQPERKRVEA